LWKDVHTICLPVKVVIGRGVSNDLGTIISAQIAGSEVALLTGPNLKTKLLDPILESLTVAGFKPFIEIVNSPSLAEVERIYHSFMNRNLSPSAVIGVGGGKVLDVGKVIAYRINTNFISVPTSASHDGIASPQASLKGLSGAHSVRVKTPYMIIADSEVIASSPKSLTLSGIGDVLAKLSSTLDSRLAQSMGEYVGEYSISLAEMSAKLVFENLDSIVSMDDHGIRTLLEALISNGIAMAIAGSSRPCSGSEHMFGHALDYLTSSKLLHGFSVALGTKVSLALHGQDWRTFDQRVHEIGIPMNAKSLGIPPIYLIRALSFAHKIRPERKTILGNGISYINAKKILEEVKAI
jgi:glycerol-1-phosphate dehydrogenase [NAD(P)+]